MSDKFVVDIKDFQSLKKVHLELPKGLTIVTGGTNNGKSAVFRAIDSALFNIGDDSMIRGGKRYYGVAINNGLHTLMFVRDGVGKNEKTSYQFDGGTVQKKVGRGQLEEVANMFNIRDVKMQNGTKMKINFWYQNDKPFLMDKTSGQLYEFLSLSSCDKYSKILKLMRADEKVLKANISSVTAQIDTLKAINLKKKDFIDKNEGFDDVYIKVVTASQDKQKNLGLISVIRDISSLNSKIQDSKQELQKVLNQYNSIPVTDLNSRVSNALKEDNELQNQVILVKSISDLNGQLTHSKKECEKVTSDYKGFSDKVDSISPRISHIESETVVVDSLMSVVGKVLKDKDSISSLKKQALYIEKQFYSDIEGLGDKVKKYTTEFDTLERLNKAVAEVDSVGQLLKGQKDKLEKVVAELNDKEKKLDDLKKSVGYCPFCGTVFS